MKLTEEEQSLLNDPVWKKQRQQFWSKVAYPELRSIWGTGYDEDLGVQTRDFYAALKQVFMTGRIGPQGPDTYEGGSGDIRFNSPVNAKVRLVGLGTFYAIYPLL